MQLGNVALAADERRPSVRKLLATVDGDLYQRGSNFGCVDTRAG